ncbi:glucokinase [Segetibacter koreensis]|uniref:glucokinase n=1 Tax=Segetibacter koreensis TaxID=398037 RepID=UPI00037AAB83|nr:glucokinase [Segetibacter koreensis]
MSLPIAFIQGLEMRNGGSVLAGDVGGTKTNLAVFKKTGNELAVIKEASFMSKNFTGIIEMMQAFLSGDTVPDIISLGVAGPVQEGKVNITNLSQQIDVRQIAQQLNVEKIYLINDLEATAYGLAALNDKDLFVLLEGGKNSVGNIAIIAPGTGLGEAGMFWDGNHFHPFATEGGHCDFAARTEPDISLYRYLQKKFGHVSWERVVSGPGIINMYEFLRDVMKIDEPQWLVNRKNDEDFAVTISKNALNKKSAICTETMNLFFRYLAEETANLVLKLKATGGVFIGGGILPEVYGLLQKEYFLKSFCNSGRMDTLLKEVPVKIILNEKTALLGAASYVAYGK